MIIELLKIAVDNPEGFTVSIPDLENVSEGIIVSYAATQDSFGIDGLKKVFEHALAHDQIIGGWSFDGKYFFDSNKLFTDLEEAIAFGKSQKQIAIFDLTEQRLIKL